MGGRETEMEGSTEGGWQKGGKEGGRKGGKERGRKGGRDERTEGGRKRSRKKANDNKSCTLNNININALEITT